MEVILKAISHPEFGNIRIEDSLFPIGRQEAPFSAHSGAATAKLSRRHARIFEQDDSYFLVDAGSLNGTWLNGKRLGKQAAKLHHGDEIRFADQLVFRVELTHQQVPDQAQQHANLILTPTDPEAGLDTLIISSFPFLVSQTEGAFPRYQDSLADALKHLSRRHAHIFLKHDQPYLEDLGSTNGTFVGKQRLDEHAVLLNDGDTVTFGSPTFRYRVSLAAEPTGPVASPAAESPDASPDAATAGPPGEPRTIFINSASPFLDIFCQQQPSPRPEAGDADANGRQLAPSASTSPGGRLSRMRVFLKELRQALGLAEMRLSPVRLGLATLVVLLLATPGLLVYQRGATERELKTLLADAQYLKASEQADHYLEQHPEDSSVQSLASEALLKGTVPLWQQQLRQQDYTAARKTLETATSLTRFHPEGQQLLALLGWVTDLDQFFTDRPAGDALVLFKHEQQISALLTRWEKQPNDHRRLLDLVRYHVPAVEPLHSRTFSRLRQLEYERAVYLTAIDSLKQRLQILLASQRLDQLAQQIDQFARQYPKIQGIELLRQDLDDYRVLQQVITRHDLIMASQQSEQFDFRTPLFQQAAREQLQQARPPAGISAVHQQAQQAWQAGEAQQAIALLEPLIGQPWGAAAKRQLQHYQTVHSDYLALQANHEAPDYGPRLIAFYSSLDPQQDGFYLNVLQDQFQRYAEQAHHNADEALLAAERLWQQYQQNGGITSALRLEGSISASFRQRAGALNQAYEQIHRGTRLYNLLQQIPAPAWQALQQQIDTEVHGQRQWLQDLSTVLDPPLLQAKLQLLAPTEEANP